MSVVRERDTTREWDRESARDGPRTFTTVRRYKVPDSILRDNHYEREDEMRIVRRAETAREATNAWTMFDGDPWTRR